jgi:hypothetical protein
MWKKGSAMSMTTTRRSRPLAGAVLVALGAFAVARAEPVPAAAPAPATSPKRHLAPRQLPLNFPLTNRFYEAYLAPRMLALSRDENARTALSPANPMSTQPTQDPIAVARVEKRSIRVIQGALKSYAIERLGIDDWSLSMMRSGGRNHVALSTDRGTARFRLGFSSRAPRADVLIPVAAGRVVFSADMRGRIATTFQSTSSRIRLAADIDVRGRRAAVGLNLQF